MGQEKPPGETATIEITINECGEIVKATENGADLKYGEAEQQKELRMDDPDSPSRIRRNPCCWRKRHGRWVCIPC